MEAPIFDQPAYDPAVTASVRRIHAAGRKLQLGALLAALAVLAAHVAVSVARDSLDPIVLGIDAVLALALLAAVCVHIENLGRQRRRHAVVQQIATTFALPRNIEETAQIGVELMVAAGLAQAGIVAVARYDGEPARSKPARPSGANGARDPLDAFGSFEDFEPHTLGDNARLVPIATSGYAIGADDLDEEGVPGSAFSETTVRRERIDSDRWLLPLAETLGERPWVARIPLERGDELLGALVLASGPAGALRDRVLLRVVSALFAAALDHSRLYQAAFEQARDLEAQDGRRREFLYAITHELRTPLTSIQAFADLLAEEHAQQRRGRRRSREDEEQLVSSLARGVQRLSELVDDLLRLGRVEEVDVHVELAPVDASDALRSAEAILRPSFLQREQTLTMDLPEEPLWVMGDDRTLEQVLINLLSNANRHTPPHGEVRVRAFPASGQVRIEVRDSGPGIDPADRERIFEPFYRVPRPGAAQVPGSGLGLAVARRFTELLRGRIWVDGGEDGRVGARFCVELAAPPAEAIPAAVMSLEAPSALEEAEAMAAATQLRMELNERRSAER